MSDQITRTRIALLISLVIFFPVQGLAQTPMTFDQAIQEGQAFGKAQPQGKDAANNLINNAQTQGVPGLTPQAQSQAQAEGSFYSNNPGQLNPLGTSALQSTDVGQWLEQSYNLRPRTVINPDDPMITLSQQAASGLTGCITQQVCTQPTSQMVSGTRQVTCSVEYTERSAQCSYTLPPPTTQWRPWLKVEVVGQNILWASLWAFRLSLDTNGDGIYDRTILTPSGVQNIMGFHTSGPYLFQAGWWWSWWWSWSWWWNSVWTLNSSGNWIPPTTPVSNSWWVPSDSASYPNRQTAAGYLMRIVANAFGVNTQDLKRSSEWFGEGSCFELGSDHCYSAVWEKPYIVLPPASPATIAAACGAYINNQCTMAEEQCTPAGCTRSYVCVDQTRTDGCAPYRDRGCTLNSSTCAATDQYGLCLTQNEIYACTVQTLEQGCAQESTQVICPGSLDGIRCLNPSECADTASTPSGDLALAASNMQSLDAVEHDHTNNPLVIFTGNSLGCRKSIASWITRDCCTLDAVLLGCSSSEELLQTRRQKGQCVEVGTYCSQQINLLFTSICVEQTTSFCCFSSKLTRIIQQQGRQQLGIGWGSPQNPDCRGFTPQELQAINFEKIDFSEYYSDISYVVPDNGQLSTQVQGSSALTPNPGSVPPPSIGISQGQVQQDINQFYGTHGP